MKKALEFTHSLIMSITVTLSGNSSTLSSHFFPPIILEGSWEIGMLNLETFNSIPNLKKGEVKYGSVQKIFKSKEMADFGLGVTVELEDTHKVEGTVVIPTGSYELNDISHYINSKSKTLPTINFHGNRNTLKTEIVVHGTDKFIQVNKELGQLLGLEGGCIFYSNVPYELEKPTKISKVNVVRINCNIAQSSYLNGKPTHTIHEFFPNAPPGYRIIEVPNNVIYHSINTRRIDSIHLELIDQDDNILDFRGETITIRLHLKQVK